MTSTIKTAAANRNGKKEKLFCCKSRNHALRLVHMKSPTPAKRPIYISPSSHRALQLFAAARDIKLTAAAEMAVVAMTSKPTRKAAAK
jgi:hypothetical protein